MSTGSSEHQDRTATSTNTVTRQDERVQILEALAGIRRDEDELIAAVDRLRPVIASCREATHERAVTVLSKLLADLET
jgi:hypothetical protein